ncbi:hypothetical protein IG631_24006 [Alternaria alternata]|nr:hypothetical protein IG631_24340 [Alternaria alternata]KAH8621371.1 hypothetical protein IG631_24006 [Alternaria alternata]
MSGQATRERLCEVYQCKFEGLQYSAVTMQMIVANACGAVCTRRVTKFTSQTLHDQRRSAALTAHARADYCELQERTRSTTSRSTVALQRLRDHGSLVLGDEKSERVSYVTWPLRRTSPNADITTSICGNDLFRLEHEVTRRVSLHYTSLSCNAIVYESSCIQHRDGIEPLVNAVHGTLDLTSASSLLEHVYSLNRTLDIKPCCGR